MFKLYQKLNKLQDTEHNIVLSIIGDQDSWEYLSHNLKLIKYQYHMWLSRLYM